MGQDERVESLNAIQNNLGLGMFKDRTLVVTSRVVFLLDSAS
jgi:hypothetical protein